MSNTLMLHYRLQSAEDRGWSFSFDGSSIRVQPPNSLKERFELNHLPMPERFPTAEEALAYIDGFVFAMQIVRIATPRMVFV